MSKRISLFISAMLIVASILIHFLLEKTTMETNLEWYRFFTGFLFGMGLTILLSLLFKKKEK